MHVFAGPSVPHLLEVYGLWVLFAFVFLESTGVPLPGEAALVSAALFAGATHRFDLVQVILVAFAAAVAGDTMGYALGRRFGLPFLLRHGSRLRLTPERLKIGEYLFRRHGGKIVFLGRFVALLRVLAALLAGANRMAYARFAVANALGALAWASAFAAGAYLLGDRMRRLEGPLALALSAIVGCLLVAAWLTLRRYEKALYARASAAAPR